MSTGLGIFVKTPTLSPIKTRLAVDVGRSRAEEFHLSSARAVASVARQAGDCLTPYWAVAEPQGMTADLWCDLPRILQGPGGLGIRMASVYRQLRESHHGALLVGADTPQISPPLLQRASQWLCLSGPRLVVGPSTDGGFWLFGGNCSIPDASWTGTTYSRESTRREFLAAMPVSADAWLELDELTDMDSYDDLPAVVCGLQHLAAPTDAQLRLTEWLDGWCRSNE